MELISSGTIHQGLVGASNTQCMANGVCAIAFSVIFNKRFIRTDEIDNLLRAGNTYYEQIRSQQIIQNPLLAVDELIDNFSIFGRKVGITSQYLNAGLYPYNQGQFVHCYEALASILDDIFLVQNNNECGYLFTGLNVTISFWLDQGDIFYFDPHAIDTNGFHSFTDSKNKARLFRFRDSRSLAQFLLSKSPFDGQQHQYDYHVIYIRDLGIENLNINILNLPFIRAESSSSQDSVPLSKRLAKNTKLTDSRILSRTESTSSCDSIPLAIRMLKFPNKSIISSSSEDSIPLADRLKRRQVDSTPTDDSLPLNQRLKSPSPKQIKKILNTSKKAGRPTNTPVGRPKIDTRTKEKQIRDAVDRFFKKHPEVVKETTMKYKKKNPSIQKKAEKKYSQNHPQIVLNKNTKYNTQTRNTPLPLRNQGLLAALDIQNLDKIKPYNFKIKSLRSPAIHKCLLCQAPLFEEEKSRTKWCCGEGRNITPMPEIHAQFYQNRQFLDQARKYNNLFAFSAIGVSHNFQNPTSGISFVKIQGRTYHRVFDLSYSDTVNPIGLYFDANERHSEADRLNLNFNLVEEITQYLNEVNPFIPLFRQLNNLESENAHIVFENTTRRTHGNILGDIPLGNEVAAILRTENERFLPRSIAIWKIGEGRPHTVDVFHPLYESLQYPLLYPYGTSGWHPYFKNSAGLKISQVKYYRLLILSNRLFSEIGRLSEEWLVDMYCRVEEERLRFISNAQKSNDNALRGAPLQELLDDETIQGEGGVTPGRVYLPNTFTSGPRYMKTKYMDGMAIVNRLGKPSYFLTMTCNPNWPELKDSAPQGQRPSSVLCARVFQLKLQELLRDIRKGNWFGRKIYILYVIEFQKRGLPHAHIAFRVEGGGPVQSTDIDKFVRADVPAESEASGRLRTLVLKHMIHGPCGQGHRTDLPCWDKESCKCAKYFPKYACEVTHVDDKGFVHYKRNASNIANINYNNNSVEVNDCWVVAYNASLLLKYDCHINLEIASTRKIVKYLFKYINKGPDYARVALVPEERINDEIEQYVTKRYIGACDSAWRILEFDVTGREPTVIELPVHLQQRQFILFRSNNRQEAIQHASSKLLVYFNRPDAREFDNLTYIDFYENYIIHSKRPRTSNTIAHAHKDGIHFITQRQRGEMVARMIWLPPKLGEIFYLRLLLSVVPARGYQDLLAQGGENCVTFQVAARALGLANDSEEYHMALEEASSFMTGPFLRRFFVLLIINGAPAALLWENFRHAICEDFLERHEGNEERAFTSALIAIGRQLVRHGTSLVELGLPDVADDSTELGRERLRYDVPISNRFVETWLPLLSAEQKELFNYVISLTEQEPPLPSFPRALFLDGPSGTGKTMVLKVITAHLRSKGAIVLCCASSGIAAQNHDGGFTAHSLFRLPLDIPDETAYWNLTNRTQRASLIFEASVIIFDEAPMAHKRLIHLLDRSLRDLMNCQDPFGGKIIIFAGDFRQIAPVVIDARTAHDVISSSMRTSHLWEQLKKFSLSSAQRTRGDEEYSKFLLDLGNGNLSSRYIGEGNNRTLLCAIPNVPFVTELSALINSVFPTDLLSDPDGCANRSVLSILNVNVREINLEILNSLPGEVIHLYSADSVADETANDLLLGSDGLNHVQAKGVPDHDLVLKIGAVCMIMRNLSFDDRLVNGTKVIVVATSPRIISVRKPGENDIHLIPRIIFKMPVDIGGHLDMCRRQFPLQLAYAMTVNKSQGQTIDTIGVDLRSDSFTHGQTYVAFGRVRSSSSITILVDRERVIDGVPHVKNIVYRELLPQ